MTWLLNNERRRNVSGKYATKRQKAYTLIVKDAPETCGQWTQTSRGGVKLILICTVKQYLNKSDKLTRKTGLVEYYWCYEEEGCIEKVRWRGFPWCKSSQMAKWAVISSTRFFDTCYAKKMNCRLEMKDYQTFSQWFGHSGFVGAGQLEGTGIVLGQVRVSERFSAKMSILG